MLDDQAGQDFSPEARALRAISVAVRATWSRIPLGVVACVVGLASIWGSWAVEAVGPSPCMELQQAEFPTIEELIGTKDKVLAYVREPVGELSLSGKEASFVLADNLQYPVWIETRNDELFVQMALPDDERCYNIEFLGRVSVEGGLAHVVPSAVRAGQLDLSPFVRGRALDVTPSDITGPKARQLLTQTRKLRVEDDAVLVTLDDPGSLL